MIMKEIKEKIDVNSLVPAPLDNKNVMLDWWKENMFDDENYSFNGNVYLGFIAGLPVMATIRGNVVTAKCIPQILRTCEDLDLFTSTIVKNLTGHAFEMIHSSIFPRFKQYIDEQRKGQQLIISFELDDNEAIVTFNWNVLKDVD